MLQDAVIENDVPVVCCETATNVRESFVPSAPN